MEQFLIYDIAGTNSVVLGQLISSLIPITLFYITENNATLVANNWSIVKESLIVSISKILRSYLGQGYFYLLPLFYSIFYLILFCNLLGLVPYNTTSTVELILTLTIAGTILLGVIIIGQLIHRRLLIAAFIPSGTPVFLLPLMILLEILAFLTRTFSQGLRLAVNLITGHILAKVIIGFIYAGYVANVSAIIWLTGVLFLSLFLALEILIAYLQAYIFVFIICLTLHDYI